MNFEFYSFPNLKKNLREKYFADEMSLQIAVDEHFEKKSKSCIYKYRKFDRKRS